MSAVIDSDHTISFVPPEVAQAGHKIAEALLTGGTAAWGTMIGKNVAYSIASQPEYGAPAETLADMKGEHLVTEISWTGDRTGTLWLVVGADGAKTLVAHMMALMMGGAPDPQNTQLDAEGLDAYTEAANNFIGQAAQQLRGDVGGTIKLAAAGTRIVDFPKTTPAEALGTAERLCQRMRITADGAAPFPAVVLMDVSVTGLSVASPAEECPIEKVTRILTGARSDNIDHTMKLKVPLIVVVAARNMRMEKIQEMRPGTILEFRKMSGEMLDVMAGKVKIGEAEVVIVHQHFGIQIRRIVDPRAAKPG